jgi:hypothetical protein
MRATTFWFLAVVPSTALAQQSGQNSDNPFVLLSDLRPKLGLPSSPRRQHTVLPTPTPGPTPAPQQTLSPLPTIPGMPTTPSGFPYPGYQPPPSQSPPQTTSQPSPAVLHGGVTDSAPYTPYPTPYKPYPAGTSVSTGCIAGSQLVTVQGVTENVSIFIHIPAPNAWTAPLEFNAVPLQQRKPTDRFDKISGVLTNSGSPVFQVTAIYFKNSPNPIPIKAAITAPYVDCSRQPTTNKATTNPNQRSAMADCESLSPSRGLTTFPLTFAQQQQQKQTIDSRTYAYEDCMREANGLPPINHSNGSPIVAASPPPPPNYRRSVCGEGIRC